ncbi:S-layer homology domain-containing protein [Lysinibacillus sp. SGAir0095]|uniref:CAP and S-layer homology domain-containing protein n=1 Tax=Lysinibacillus sp. SGAir0095 TaxID=2070463 RepID=UPI00143D5EBE|nr:S-layer homology domain-containing protein [Lysinibacillus sp. SGAir0095]
MLKRTVSIILCLLILQFSGVLEVQAGNSLVSPFKDVNTNHWAFKEIQNVTSKNFMAKSSSNTFSPNGTISRADAVTTIARSLNLDKVTDYKPKFVDVDTKAPYYNALSQLVERSIVKDGKNFYPNNKITRAEFVVMLANAYEVEIDDVNKKSFKDLPKNYWAKNDIEALADLGIIGGVDGVNFAPERKVSRAQLAIFISRALEFKTKVNNNQIIYDYLSKDYLDTKQYSDKWVKEVIGLVNEERAKAKLPALVEDKQLCQIAVVKAQDFIKRDYFSHSSVFYGQPWDLAAVFDYQFTSLGENIAKNFYTPKSVVTAWMNSDSHKENIMRSQYTNIGVGIRKSTDGSMYWVQMFASK